jgi:hypothetical protein
MDNTKTNQQITSAFGLDIPPIAMAFVDDQPLVPFGAWQRKKRSMHRQTSITTVL